jgi:hypothetical protein
MSDFAGPHFLQGSAAFGIVAQSDGDHQAPRNIGVATSRAGPAATTDDISAAGYDPTTVALSWSQSGDVCFDSYNIHYATYSSGGPWTTMNTFTSADITSLYVSGWTPGETVWFEDVDNSGCFGGVGYLQHCSAHLS